MSTATHVSCAVPWLADPLADAPASVIAFCARWLQEGTRRGGDISHFLLAVVDRTNLRPDELPRRWYTFCKVGSGYTIPELTELRERLRDKWRPYDKRRAPAWLQGWRPEPGDVPDVVIEPSDSLIVEIKCYEIIPCPASKFLAEFTCRFPRVIRFRYNDKHWHEAESIDTIRQLAAQDRVRGRKMEEEAAVTAAAGQGNQPFIDGASPPHSPTPDTADEHGIASELDGQWGLAGQLTASQDGIVDAQGRGGKKMGKKRGRGHATADECRHLDEPGDHTVADRTGQKHAAAGGVLPLFQAASGLSNIERRSALLDGVSVVVMVQPECRPSKAELERLVVQHGGEVRQNPPAQHDKQLAANHPRCVLLSDGRSSYKLQAHQRSGRFDIVHFSWLTHCIEQGRLTRYKHDQVISATTATASERSRQVDRYGDDYTEDVQALEDIKLSLCNVRQSLVAAEQPVALSAPASTADMNDGASGNSGSTHYRKRAGETGRVKPPPPSPSVPHASSPALLAHAAATADSSHARRSVLAQVEQGVVGLQPRLFDGVRAVLGSDEAETVDSLSVDAAIVHCALLLNGAEVSPADGCAVSDCDAAVTHCIALSSSEAGEQLDEWRGQAVRVAAAWVTDSLRSGKRQDEAEYVLPSIDVAH